jgi:hypothetical protein
VVGFFGFGATLQNQAPWAGPVVLYGIIYFAMSFLNIGIYGYITECHRNKAPEAFASLNLRNIYSFGMNYFISGTSLLFAFPWFSSGAWHMLTGIFPDWITKQGPLEVFSTIGGLHIFICLLTIPMWIFGKRCRSFTARNKFFRKIQES